MAIWIYAYAKNGLLPDGLSNQQYIDLLEAIPLDETVVLDSIRRQSAPGEATRKYYEDPANRKGMEQWLQSLSEKAYHDYLNSIRLPYIEKTALIERFIADAAQREREDDVRFNSAYALGKSGTAASKWELAGEHLFVNRLQGYFTQNYDGLKVSLSNDLIRITGPFAIFAKYFVFLQHIPDTTQAYYHSYFKKIARAFKSDFILYAHEWSGMDDEDNEAFDLAELKESSDWENNSSDSLSKMDKFYYENL